MESQVTQFLEDNFQMRASIGLYIYGSDFFLFLFAQDQYRQLASGTVADAVIGYHLETPKTRKTLVKYCKTLIKHHEKLVN